MQFWTHRAHNQLTHQLFKCTWPIYVSVNYVIIDLNKGLLTVKPISLYH